MWQHMLQVLYQQNTNDNIKSESSEKRYKIRSTRTKHRYGVRKVVFDSDSVHISVDNKASTSISPHSQDFEGAIKMVDITVDGIASGLTAVGKGTLKWKWQDDEGVTHTFKIPNFLYVPKAPMRILFPQHWSQEVHDKSPDPHGTWCATYNDRCMLYWKQNTKWLTV